MSEASDATYYTHPDPPRTAGSDTSASSRRPRARRPPSQHPHAHRRAAPESDAGTATHTHAHSSGTVARRPGHGAGNGHLQRVPRAPSDGALSDVEEEYGFRDREDPRRRPRRGDVERSTGLFIAVAVAVIGTLLCIRSARSRDRERERERERERDEDSDDW